MCKYLKILAGASFSYGCYRGWTLPGWYNMSNSSRVICAVATGVKYSIPPFCIIKFIQMSIRVTYYYRGYTYDKYPKFLNELYTEWGIFHPRVF